jgi:hypothetical protein
MSIRRRFIQILPLLIVVSLGANAQPPATTDGSSATTVAVDCDNRYISQQDAARLLHTDNFSQTYAKRQSLYANVARMCQDGGGQVLLVSRERQLQPQPQPRSVASR